MVLLIEVKDKVFVFEIFGKGIVILLEKGRFVVLVDGVILIVFLMGYVFGMVID